MLAKYLWRIASEAKPDPIIPKDCYNCALKVGDKVIFILAGCPTYGEIAEFKTWDWKLDEYHKKHYPDKTPYWRFTGKTKVKVTKKNNNGYDIGHISTLKTTDTMLKYD